MPAAADRVGADRRGELPLIVVALMLVAATVSWRRNDYFSGSLDPVVAIKASLSVAALGLAFFLARRTERRRPVSLLPTGFFALMLLTSLFGAKYTALTLSASIIDVIRLTILATAVFELVRAYPIYAVARAIFGWMLVVALVAAVTGIGTYATKSRLEGGIPPLVANGLTELCGLVLIPVLWRAIRGVSRRWEFGLIAVLIMIVWFSGSRTGLLAIVLAVVVLFAQARRLPVGVVVVSLLALPAVVYLMFATSVLSKFLNRGGSANIDTLSSRTVAWSAALHLHHGFWEVAFGNGLSRVQIPVVIQYRNTQILDSSWVSALVQSGVVGLVLLALWIGFVIRAARRAPRNYRMAALAILVFIVFRSFLESGLVGATPSFLVFVLISFGSDPRAWSGPLPAATESSALNTGQYEMPVFLPLAPVSEYQ